MQELSYLMPPVVKIKLMREESAGFYLSEPNDVYEILRNYIENEDREHFVSLLLDTKGQVVGIHTVSIGNLNSSLVTNREIFKAAILSNCASIIVAHNHPSGDPTPSDDDITVTKEIIKAGKLLGIEVLDHVIIGSNKKYFSMHDKRTLVF